MQETLDPELHYIYSELNMKMSSTEWKLSMVERNCIHLLATHIQYEQSRLDLE